MALPPTMSSIKAAAKNYGRLSAGKLRKPKVDFKKCGLVVEVKDGDFV